MSRTTIELSLKPSSIGSINIPQDRIIIRDVGIGWRSEAFYWLTRGFNVCDNNFNELTVYDIERDIDPKGVMDPIYLRWILWSALPTNMWLSKRFEPLQPGLNAELISIYYAQRRVPDDHVLEEGSGNAVGFYRHRKALSGAPILLRRRSSTISEDDTCSPPKGENPIASENSNLLCNAFCRGNLNGEVQQRPRTAPPTISVQRVAIAEAKTDSAVSEPPYDFAADSQSPTPAQLRDSPSRMPHSQSNRQWG